LLQSLLYRNLECIIYLKRELYRPLVSVKARGVIYTLSRIQQKMEEQKTKGVIAISTGSFAYILCYYGNKFHIPVTVVMPTSIRKDHVIKCRNTGVQAKVVLHGIDMIEVHKHARNKNLFYLDGYSFFSLFILFIKLSIKLQCILKILLRNNITNHFCPLYNLILFI